jgi:glutathione synthase
MKPQENIQCKYKIIIKILKLSRNSEEVSLFYYRDGYIPENYSMVPGSWELRERIEKSSAIKCPDVFTQITNLKFIQYLINRPETWNHFNFSRETYEANKKNFCEILTMEDF